VESNTEWFEEGCEMLVEPRGKFMAPGGRLVKPALESSLEEATPKGLFPGAAEAKVGADVISA